MPKSIENQFTEEFIQTLDHFLDKAKIQFFAEPTSMNLNNQIDSGIIYSGKLILKL